MDETYRTLVGHFRHEIGHYYWVLLIREGGRLETFRALFGDEREDHGRYCVLPILGDPGS